MNLYNEYLQPAFTLAIDLLSWAHHWFDDMADRVEPIPALGRYLEAGFRSLADVFYDLMLRVWDLGAGLDLLFDKFSDIEDYSDIFWWATEHFFGGKWSFIWWSDSFWDTIDAAFPWLRDPELTIWDWMCWRVEELIPDFIPTPWDIWNSIYDWAYNLINDLIPSFLDIWDNLYDWIVAEIVSRIPSWDDIYDAIAAWFNENLPDLSELSLDPVKWIADRLEDALGLFLNVVGAPFLRVLEAFVLKMWDTEE